MKREFKTKYLEEGQPEVNRNKMRNMIINTSWHTWRTRSQM